MTFMNRHDGESKFQSLLDALTDCDRRRSYYLSLATCYCTPEAVREFIDAIQAKLRIAKIHLYLDRRIAISIGHADLRAMEQAFPDVLSIYAVKAGRLFHTKGYCVAAYSQDDEVIDGRLAIGSANLTSPGLTGRHGNIESLAIHSDPETIGEFLEFFETTDTLIALKNLTNFSRDDPADVSDFQYALLTFGSFLHKWSATLASHFSVRYQLNEEGRRRVRERSPEEIESLDFQMEVASIAKPYFHFDLKGWRPPDDGNLVRNFGIECFLGHWIPKSVVDGDKEDNQRFREFKAALFSCLDSKMDGICQSIERDYELLTGQKIIEERNVDPIQAFRDKREALWKDEVQLRRIWSGRHFFDFPYDPGDIGAIRETFDDIVHTALRRRRRNTAMRAVMDAVKERSLKPLRDQFPPGR